MVCEKFLDFKEGVGTNPCPPCPEINCSEKNNKQEMREPQEPRRFKKEGWRYEYMQTYDQLQEEIAKPFEEKLRRTKQLVRLFATRENASIACSFGKDSMAVLYLCHEANPNIKVNFNNTWVEMLETMRLKEKVVEDWDLNFYELHPEKGVTFYSINDRIIREGQRLDQGHKHANQCCYGLKEKPFILWAREQKIHFNFTGITAQESRNRMWTACSKGQEYYNHKMGVWKIHPILYWTEEEVWQFTKDNNLPVNEAYDKYGIDRIGCQPCMSYKTWKENLSRIAPKQYCYVCKRYCKYRGIQDPEFYQDMEAPEIYA